MKVQIDGWIHAESKGAEVVFNFWPYEHWLGAVPVMPHTIEVEIPADFDPVPRVVEELRRQQRDLRAETEGKCMVLEERIQSMLALPFHDKPQAAGDAV